MGIDLEKVIAIAVISLMGAMSPGPDFALVTKNSLSGSFRSGFLTTLGIFAALFIHITYCVLGIALIISQSPLIFNIIKYLGAAYLFYLGIMLLKEKSSPSKSPSKHPQKNRPFLSGFLCNLLNPKATLFILSLFTQFIDPMMPFWSKFALGSIIAFMALLWFTLLTYLITHSYLNKHFAKFQAIITKVMGVVLCLLSLYVAFLS